MMEKPLQRTHKSVFWTTLQSAFKQALDLLIFIFLARLLMPEAFGLLALVNTVLVVILLICELGLIEALVQRKRLNSLMASTAFWLAAGGGLVWSAVFVATSYLTAALYGQKQLVPVFLALCPLILLTSLNVVPQALFQRRLMFRPLAIRGIFSTLMGGIAGVFFAFQQAGVWSLVAQQLVAAVAGFTFLWLQSKWYPKWRFSIANAKELLVFSRHILFTKGLNIVASKVDDAGIGLILGPVALGAYALAGRLRLALEQLFCQGVDAIALSAFSRMTSQRSALARGYLKATRIALALALPVFLSAAWLVPYLLPFLIGSQWDDSITALQVLLIAGLLQSVLHFNHALFRAIGQPERSWHLGLASLLLNLLFVAVAVHWGVTAVAWAYACRVVCIGPVGSILACRALHLDWSDYAKAIGLPLKAGMYSIFMFVCIWQLLTYLPITVSKSYRGALLAWAPAALLYIFHLRVYLRKEKDYASTASNL